MAGLDVYADTDTALERGLGEGFAAPAVLRDHVARGVRRQGRTRVPRSSRRTRRASWSTAATAHTSRSPGFARRGGESRARPRHARPGPLAGLRVIELGTLLAGLSPDASSGDMGAEVIKVEAPGKPDPLREWGQARYRGRTLMGCSRATRGVTLNLRTERGQELLLELVRAPTC